MKSNILISSFAALCLMLTIAEVPSRMNNEKETTVSANPFSYLPIKSSNAVSGKKITVKTSEEANPLVSQNLVQDFSYLKFDVSDYTNSFERLQNELDGPSNIDQNSFGYLKFDVSNYIKNDKPNNLDSNEPANEDFTYLKFDVSKFAPTESTNEEEESVSNADGFEYLKFETNKYSSQSADSLSDFGELPTVE